MSSEITLRLVLDPPDFSTLSADFEPVGTFQSGNPDAALEQATSLARDELHVGVESWSSDYVAEDSPAYIATVGVTAPDHDREARRRAFLDEAGGWPEPYSDP